MAKQHNKKSTVSEQVENALTEVETETSEAEQAVEDRENFAKNEPKETASTEQHEELKVEETKPKQEKAKSGGKAIALLALLVALGVGGAGHYFANTKFAQVDSQLQALAKGISQVQNGVAPSAVEIPTFEAEKAQIAQLSGDYQKALERVAQLEREQSSYTQQINALQAQVQKLGANPATESSTWLMSEADFLLNNALRKVVLDNDIETAKSLLIEADNVLNQVSDPKVLPIREAIKADLNSLADVNQVDQNNLMQRLAALANLVDDMPLAESDEEREVESGEVSSSIDDWQKNIEKSADSFLSHFIRINDKAKVSNDKGFIAPNQEIYLRENIRLRLQIAMMTIPRQQNELYKQSLDAVSTWVRSYFDVENGNVKQFLKEIDSLMEQAIYIDAPSRLQSFNLLSESLNRVAKPIVKVQIEEDKSIEAVKAEEKPAETAPAEQKAEPSEQPAQPAAQ